MKLHVHLSLGMHINRFHNLKFKNSSTVKKLMILFKTLKALMGFNKGNL